jgi:diguanylate cyclase (GGDEF)-like protein
VHFSQPTSHFGPQALPWLDDTWSLEGVADIVRGSERPGLSPDSPTGDRRLRRTRLLTGGFAWITAIGVLMSLIGANGPALPRFAGIGLIIVVLLWWLVRKYNDSLLAVAVEAAAITVSAFVAVAAEPVVGLLFGITTRRAVRGGLGPWMVRAIPGVAGYLVVTLVTRLDDPAGLAPRLLPLLGLLIGTLALGDMVAAAREARSAEDTATTAARQLRDRAERDQLTDVASRAHFGDLLHKALQNNRPALLVIDLDDFKSVNDTHGHPIGDEVLIDVGQRISDAVGDVGIVGRLGGDEFAVLIPDHDKAVTTRAAERILTAIAARPVAPTNLNIHASIGIAVPGEPREPADVLMRDADTALYVAKRAGGNQAQTFHQQLRDDLLARRQQETELREALAHQQFELHYQPIVNLRTGTVSSAEALIRWRHPQRGLVAPGPVVELAEQTGLIVPLGTWVLTEACRQVVRWNDEGIHIAVSVNVSAHQLRGREFLDTLTRVVAETGVPPAQLTLELTESALAENSALELLRAIQRLGIRIALDDFGTGYSSLSYLQRHRFDLIKIDRSFTATLGRVPTAEGIVHCVIELAAVLDIQVVAEGVETSEQAEFLVSAGCALGQGYHYAKPVPVSEWRQRGLATMTLPVPQTR